MKEREKSQLPNSTGRVKTVCMKENALIYVDRDHLVLERQSEFRALLIWWAHREEMTFVRYLLKAL